MWKALVAVLALALLVLAGLWLLGGGLLGEDWTAGVPTPTPIPPAVVSARSEANRAAAVLAGESGAKQILFGDLHVHTSYSTDAFLMSLPLAGGDGARPVSHACDFARFCSGLDFWSVNDHALALTPRRWRETVEAIRQCNDVAQAGGGADPDVVAFLGWEWTQIGTTPENHYGHKNVVLRHLDDAQIPARPIEAGLPTGARQTPPRLGFGLAAALASNQGGIDLARYFDEQTSVPDCPAGPVRELPLDCIERAATPGELFAKLDEWGHEALVIPHGTTWGFYTPQGSAWDKQLTPEQHDPQRQTLIEVYSGHGNSEEYRSWREVGFDAAGAPVCPEPSAAFEPSCWRAGEIIRGRCLAAGESADGCEARAVAARADYVAADISGHLSVPGARGTDWGDSGQCRDCFLPAFNYRPRSSVQYIMALGNFAAPGEPLRFRFGFMASSDNHSARAGTGYKEYGRREMTEARFGELLKLPFGGADEREPAAESVPFDAADSPVAFFGLRETERQASFFLTGGLVAAHAAGRSRDGVWQALERREVYGTSGPRILLWFDLLDLATGERHPMGSAVTTAKAPSFQVRAVGSFEQLPGCPDFAGEAIGPDALARLCGGECYNPSDQRRPITRIEVVRIRPQQRAGEPVEALIEDPWRVLPCTPDLAGCRVTFQDEEYAGSGRDALYYARAIEAPSAAVAADGVACLGKQLDDDCLGEIEERAWSSPIFLDQPR